MTDIQGLLVFIVVNRKI